MKTAVLMSEQRDWLWRTWKRPPTAAKHLSWAKKIIPPLLEKGIKKKIIKEYAAFHVNYLRSQEKNQQTHRRSDLSDYMLFFQSAAKTAAAQCFYFSFFFFLSLQFYRKFPWIQVQRDLATDGVQAGCSEKKQTLS